IPQTSNLVLSMTLAEIFLLLLFVVWWGTSLEATPAGTVPPTVEVEILKAENSRLKAAVVRLEAKTREQSDTIEALRLMVGAQGTSIGDFEKAIKIRDQKTAEV